MNVFVSNWYCNNKAFSSNMCHAQWLRLEALQIKLHNWHHSIVDHLYILTLSWTELTGSNTSVIRTNFNYPTMCVCVYIYIYIYIYIYTHTHTHKYRKIHEVNREGVSFFVVFSPQPILVFEWLKMCLVWTASWIWGITYTLHCFAWNHSLSCWVCFNTHLIV